VVLATSSGCHSSHLCQRKHDEKLPEVSPAKGPEESRQSSSDEALGICATVVLLESGPLRLNLAYVSIISQVPITHVVKPIVVMNLKFLCSLISHVAKRFVDSACANPEFLLLAHPSHVSLVVCCEANFGSLWYFCPFAARQNGARLLGFKAYLLDRHSDAIVRHLVGIELLGIRHVDGCDRARQGKRRKIDRWCEENLKLQQ